MTLEQMKANVYQLIEEYEEENEDLTKDPDYKLKINSVINHIQNELARYKKIDAFIIMNVQKGMIIPLRQLADDFYQLNIIKGVEYELTGNIIEFLEEGTATIYYYKYPTQITDETDDDFEFELDIDCLEAMSYGVAGDLLKSDVSNGYGQIYSNRYKELLQGLDPRLNAGSISFEGGIEI